MTHELLLTLEYESAVPLFRQLYERLRHAIIHGLLKEGEALPPSRTLCATLGISRTVVLEAYGQLQAEGFVDARRGSRTYVTYKRDQVRHETEPLPPMGVECNERVASLLAQDDAPLWIGENRKKKASQLDLIDFQHGVPAYDAFPIKTWSRCLVAASGSAGPDMLGYAPAEGSPALRAEIARMLRHSRSLHAEPEQIVVTTGATQALDILSRVLLGPGAQVFLEDPSHPVLRKLFAFAMADVVSIPVDRGGLRVDRMDAYAGGKDAGTKLVYVTPSHQFPLGVTMSLERRLQLLDWANRHGSFIVEDDYDSEFLYEGHKLSSLAGLLHSRNVIYVGSFSKILYPALRIGYAVLQDDTLKSAFLAVKWISDRLTPTLEQEALALFMQSGGYARHIKAMNALYAERRACLVDSLRASFGSRIVLHGSEAGLHLTVELESDMSERDIARHALAEGVIVYPAADYFKLENPVKPSFLLGYAALTPNQIRKGVAVLYRIVNDR